MSYEQIKREILDDFDKPWASEELRQACKQTMLQVFQRYELRNPHRLYSPPSADEE